MRRIRSRIGAMVAASAVTLLGVVAGAATPAAAVVSQAALSIAGHGTVTVGGATTSPPNCTAPENNPQFNVFTCAPFTQSSYDTCDSDGSGGSACSLAMNAVAPTGWRFDHWAASGDDTRCNGSTAASCTVSTSTTMCDSSMKPPCSTDTYSTAVTAYFNDTRAPTVTFAQAPPPNGVVISNTQSQTFSVTTDEDGEGVTYNCQQDGGAYIGCSNPFGWSAIADGVHDFCVRPTDASGLVGGATCRHWDQELPPADSFVTTPDATTATGDASFTYTSNKGGRSDGGSVAYACAIDDGPAGDCPFAGQSYGLLANGAHKFVVWALFHAPLDPDGANHVTASPATFTWTQNDTVPPSFTVTGPSGVVVSPTQAQSISWTTTSPGSTSYTCSLDDPSSTTEDACAGAGGLTGLTDGVHVFRIVGFDGSQTTEHDVTWDQERPAVTVLDSGPANESVTSSRSARFTYHASRPGVSFQCKLDGQSFHACTSSGADSLTALSYARHTLSVRAKFVAPLDNSVHYGDGVSRTWTVQSPVRLAAIQYNSPGADNGTNASLNGEWVKITNYGKTATRMRGWTLRDAAGHVYTFGAFTLGAGKSVRIHTGRGANSTTDRYWGRTGYAWGNSKDTALVKNASGLRVSSCGWTRAGKGLVTC